MSESGKQIIGDGKFVELKYKVMDVKTDSVLTEVEYPIGYVHGVNEVLAPAVMQELAGHSAGDTIDVPLDCDKIYGPRDESLVICEDIDKVPEDYREIGTAILMENDAGDTRTFIVTRIEGTMITIDGNNPLCGREVIFKLEILTVRDATEDEIEFGGPLEEGPDLGDAKTVPIQ